MDKGVGSGETLGSKASPIKSPVPVETVEKTVPSSEEALEYVEQGKGTGEASTTEDVTQATDPTEVKKLTLADLGLPPFD